MSMSYYMQNPLGVTVGGTLGHAICTALAVIGGKFVAQKISVRTGKHGHVNTTTTVSPLTFSTFYIVTLIGSVVFLIFALTAFLHSADDSEPLT